jgi:small-conductance mechanosensitive channel
VLIAWPIVLAVLQWVKRSGVQTLKRLAVGRRERLMNLAADLLDHTHGFVLLILALNIVLWPIELRPRWLTLCSTVMHITLLIQAGLWLCAFLDFYIGELRSTKLESDPATVTTISALGILGKVAIAIVVFLLAWPFFFNGEPTALLTGLGVGGIAIGLAAQHILGDLFASMTIVLDKPFVIGDFITIGDFQGSVEHIGLKSTRLRSLSGELLVFSNQDLLGSRIRNYKHMFERRVLFKIGVTYQTPLEKLRAIPDMIRQIIRAQPKTRFDRSHFATLGDNALHIETVYFVLVADYNIYMDTQQAINLAIYERFAKEAIQFACTTPTPSLSPARLPSAPV